MAQEPFNFAGFEFPRHVPQLVPLTYCGAPSPRIAEIIAQYEGRTGAYLAREIDDAELARRVVAFRMLPKFKVSTSYSALPTPLTRNSEGFGYYLDSDFAPDLRWKWADEIEDSPIDHRGWYSEDDGAGDTIRGLVLRLPRGRGFLAGWSMGKGMSADIGRKIHQSEREAAGAADRAADRVAEAEREYQRGWRAGDDAREAGEESISARADALALLAGIKRARRNLAGEVGEPVCAALRGRVESLIETWRDKRDERDKLRREWAGHAGFAETFGEG